MPNFKPGDIVRRGTPPSYAWEEFTSRNPGSHHRVRCVRPGFAGGSVILEGDVRSIEWNATNFVLVERPSDAIQGKRADLLIHDEAPSRGPLSAVQADPRQLELFTAAYGGTVTGRMTSPNPFPQQLPKENPVSITTPEITQAQRAYDKANERAAVAVTVQSEASEALRQARLEAERKLSYYQRLCEATRQLLDSIHSPGPSGYTAIAPFADELQPLAAEFGATIVVVNARAYIKKD